MRGWVRTDRDLKVQQQHGSARVFRLSRKLFYYKLWKCKEGQTCGHSAQVTSVFIVGTASDVEGKESKLHHGRRRINRWEVIMSSLLTIQKLSSNLTSLWQRTSWWTWESVNQLIWAVKDLIMLGNFTKSSWNKVTCNWKQFMKVHFGRLVLLKQCQWLW